MGKVRTLQVIERNYEGWAIYLQNNRISAIKDKDVKTLLVDFSQASFLQPYHLVSLACLIEEYHQRGVQINFKKGGFGLDKYLENIKFYNYWDAGFDRNRFTHTKIDTALCLWKVNQDMIDSYANEAKVYFERNFFSGKDLDSLSIPLKEVFNNIYDHADSPVSGYVLTQYYPNLGEIRTAVCDFGVGIPAKINKMWVESGKDKLTDEDALRAAFRRKVSSRSTPRNRGLGLFYLLSNVNSLKGGLTLYSNSALLNHDGTYGMRLYKSNQYFRGTLINLNLKTAFLPQSEEEIEDEEFIF